MTFFNKTEAFRQGILFGVEIVGCKNAHDVYWVLTNGRYPSDVQHRVDEVSWNCSLEEAIVKAGKIIKEVINEH